MNVNKHLEETSGPARHWPACQIKGSAVLENPRQIRHLTSSTDHCGCPVPLWSFGSFASLYSFSLTLQVQVSQFPFLEMGVILFCFALANQKRVMYPSHQSHFDFDKKLQ